MLSSLTLFQESRPEKSNSVVFVRHAESILNSDTPGHFWELMHKKSSEFHLADKKMFIFSILPEQVIGSDHLPQIDIIEFWELELESKIEIAKNFLVPAGVQSAGLRAGLGFSPVALKELVIGYTREPGVRELQEVIRKVVQMVAYKFDQVTQLNKSI